MGGLGLCGLGSRAGLVGLVGRGVVGVGVGVEIEVEPEVGVVEVRGFLQTWFGRPCFLLVVVKVRMSLWMGADSAVGLICEWVCGVLFCRFYTHRF